MAETRMLSAASSPVMALAHASSSTGGSSRNMKSTMAGTSPSTATRSLTSGASRQNTCASNASSGHGADPPVSQGPQASMNASTDMARMYSPLRWVSLTTSKKAGEWLTSSRANHSTN